MPARHAAIIMALLTSAVVVQPLAAQPKDATMAKTEFEPLMGGCGGVYFMAQPGELVIEVLKRDRNARNTITELRAILVGADRRVLAEEFIPDDGEPVGSGLGPAQTVRLTAQVERPGIYALNITVSQDRYGQNLLWGFRTNCPRYLIETARGHRDERHQEPIVLESPDRPAIVAFQPRLGELSIEVSGLPADCPPPEVFDAAGAFLGRLTPVGDSFAWTAPAAETRDATPWELRLPTAHAVVNADGLTRWEASDPLPNACLWTPTPASWFAFIENRWLLTPYQRTVYGRPGTRGEVVLEAHNNSAKERRFDLSLEFPGAPWRVELDRAEITVPGRQAVPVTVRYTVPDGAAPSRCYVRVTPADTPEVTTYSTLTVRPGVAPASQPLAMPIRLRPYEHENEQLGYLPDYPLKYQPYFDPSGRPYMRTPAGIATWRDGQWVETEIASAVTERSEVFGDSPFSLISTKLAFDADGDLYLPATCAGRNALLHSRDEGRTFAAYEVPGDRGSIDIEQFSGHNLPEGPPPFVRFRRTAHDPNLKWRSLNDLELFVPRKIEGRIEIGDPILITRDCIGLAAHSGIPSSVVSRGPKVHVTWGEATDPQVEVPGVPTYVVTYDRNTGGLGEPALLGYGPPANDVHNSPSITMDAEGYLHALIGTHGRPFQYCRSLVPNDAGGGWTEPEPAGEGLGQTYIGFVCGPDNALYTVFRLWRSGEPYPNSSHATLAMQRKLPGQPWEEPRILVVAPFSEYSVFYHRLTIDPAGRMFLSYDYWSTYWFYRNDHRGDRRALLASPDGAASWKLAETSDLVMGVR